MTGVHSVKLPRSQEPTFPDRCIVCGREHPGTFTRVSNREASWLGLIIWFSGKKVTVHVPACRWCGRRLHAHQWLNVALTLIVATAISFGLRPYVVPWLPIRSVRSIVMMGLFVLGTIPTLVLWRFFPPAFELLVDSDEIDYEFKDSRYAEDFVELNWP